MRGSFSRGCGHATHLKRRSLPRRAAGNSLPLLALAPGAGVPSLLTMSPRLALPIGALASLAALLLSACPTVDLGEMPASPGACRPDPAYFRDVIWPEFIDTADENKSCVAEGGCHQLENGRSAFRVSTAEPIDFDANYNVTTRFLNCGSPESSSALTKPISGVDSHGGGDLFDEGSESETLFLTWFDL